MCCQMGAKQNLLQTKALGFYCLVGLTSVLVCLLSPPFLFPPTLEVGSCPDSTIATSEVTAEGTLGTNNVTVESAVTSADISEERDKGDCAVLAAADGKLCLRMSLVTPVNEGSDESPSFSLESKRTAAWGTWVQAVSWYWHHSREQG